MSPEAHRRLQYLIALSRLQRGLSHETRSILGSISIQLDLIGEMLDREPETGPIPGARLQGPLQRARKGCERVAANIDRILGAVAESESNGAAPNLTAQVQELQALLATTALEHHVALSVAAPEKPLYVEGRSEEIHEALIIVAVEMLIALPHEGRFEVRLEVAENRARLLFKGAPVVGAPAGWAEALALARQALPGTIESDDRGARFEWTAPIAKMLRRGGHAIRADH